MAKYRSPFLGIQTDESVDKVTRISWDAIDGITGANAPSPTNVFATMADVTGGGGGSGGGINYSACVWGGYVTFENLTDVGFNGVEHEDSPGMVNTTTNSFVIPPSCTRAIISWHLRPLDPTVGHLYLSECYKNGDLIGSSRRAASNYNSATETVGPIAVAPGDLITFKAQTNSGDTTHHFNGYLLAWLPSNEEASSSMSYSAVARNVITYQATGLEGGTFPMPLPIININALDVWLNGIKLARTAEYIISGGNFVVSTEIIAGDDIEAVAFSSIEGYQKLFVAGEELLAGDVCYLAPDSKMWKSNATVQSSSHGLLGVATTDVSVGSQTYFAIYGEIAGYSGLTVGAPYFLDTIEGKLTLVPPYNSGEIVRLAGYALATDRMLFYPSKTWVERV